MTAEQVKQEQEAFRDWFIATRGAEPDADNLITQFMEDAWMSRAAIELDKAPSHSKRSEI